jgi:hypothetical protein
VKRKRRICVVDGQGGGIGAVLIRRLKEVYLEEHEVIALGTNGIATAQMMKAHANRGASGEAAIIWNVSSADIIIGSLSIILANAMMGEVTPGIAAAIASAPAVKILLPLGGGRGGNCRTHLRTTAPPGGKSNFRTIKGVFRKCVKLRPIF